MGNKGKIGLIFTSVLICSAVYIGVNKNSTVDYKNNVEGKMNKSDNEVLLSSKNENIKSIEQEIAKLEDELNEPMMALVNRENRLSETYEPANLTTTELPFISYIETRDLQAEAAEAAKKMFDGAALDGINLLGASGYRSYNVQKNLYNSKVANVGKEKADLYSAQPGASEHQLGLALDIVGEDYKELDDGFEKSKSFQWLTNNCYKYGFILRYQKGKEQITGYNYEPWHYRYIGNVEIAKEIMDKSITFEEYINETSNNIDELKNELLLIGEK